MQWICLSPGLGLTKQFGGDRRVRIVFDQEFKLAPCLDQHSFADVEDAEREMRWVLIFQHRKFTQLIPSQELETYLRGDLFSIDRRDDAPRIDDPSFQSRRWLPLCGVG